MSASHGNRLDRSASAGRRAPLNHRILLALGLLPLWSAGCIITQAPPPAQPDYSPPPQYSEPPPQYSEPPPAYGAPTAEVYVTLEPPPPRIERLPPPRRGFVWVNGYWQWHPSMGRYVWVDGHWERARRGMSYVPGHWVRRPRGWVWVPGHWR